MHPIKIAEEVMDIPESERSLQSIANVIEAHIVTDDNPVIANALMVYRASLNTELASYIEQLGRLDELRLILESSIVSIRCELDKVNNLIEEEEEEDDTTND